MKKFAQGSGYSENHVLSGGLAIFSRYSELRMTAFRVVQGLGVGCRLESSSIWYFTGRVCLMGRQVVA